MSEVEPLAKNKRLRFDSSLIYEGEVCTRFSRSAPSFPSLGGGKGEGRKLASNVTFEFFFFRPLPRREGGGKTKRDKN